METNTQDFKLFLQELLVERTQRNPNYSLRSFAKNLNISHATLSRLLNGKRGMTKKMQKSLEDALNLSPQERKKFSIKEEKPASPKKAFKDITQDVFDLISNWQHDAILELPRVKNFRPTNRWIAKALGINIIQANDAIERLQRLELIEIDSEGNWKVSEDTTNITSNEYTSSAARKYQKEVLSKAISAIDEVNINLRDNTGITFAIDTKDIPRLKLMIKNFRRELSEFAQRPDVSADQVYQISVALFPLTQIETEK